MIISKKVASSLPDIDKSGVIVCSSATEWTKTIIQFFKEREDKPLKFGLGPKYILENFTWSAYSKAILKSVSSKT